MCVKRYWTTQNDNGRSSSLVYERSSILSLFLVIRVIINQTAIGWLAVLHNIFLLVQVAGVLGLEISLFETIKYVTCDNSQRHKL